MQLTNKLTNPKTFKNFSVWMTRSIILLVLTGGIVRLTESGLGCADWPNCTKNSFIAPLKYHALVEDTNRFVVTLVSVIIILNFIWAIKLRRKQSIITASTIIGLLVGQIFMGALVVYSHLWPPFVMLHFFLSILMIVAGVIQVHTSSKLFNNTSGKSALNSKLRLNQIERHNINLMSKLVVTMTFIVILVGTAVTGAGPHSGSIGSKRLPISYIKIAFIHIGVVSLLFFSLATLVLYISKLEFSKDVIKWGYFSIEALMAQAAVGLIQLIFHSPALVVGIHLFGACAVISIIFEFYLLVIDQLNFTEKVNESSLYISNIDDAKEGNRSVVNTD